METKQDQEILALMANPLRKLRINFIPYAKMYWYCQAAQGEISGFGKLRLEENGDYTVTEIKILEQQCSGAYTVADDNAKFNFFCDRAVTHGDHDQWNFWWHSHVNFGASPSGIDEATMYRFSQKGPFVGLIINKRAEFWVRVDYKGHKQRLGLHIIPTGVQDLMAECYEEVRKKVGDIQFKEPETDIIEEIVDESNLMEGGEVTVISDVPAGCGPVKITKTQDPNKNILYETWDEDQGWVRACGFCKKIIRDKRISKSCPHCGVDFIKTERV